MFYIWVAIIFLLAVVEAMTVNLTTIWFVVSGLVALVLSFFIDNFIIQFGAFSIIGVILLFTTRPILTKWLNKKSEKTNLDRIIGMQGVVTEEIGLHDTGEVKVDGKRWTAYSNKNIKKNSIVKILKINGVKIEVEESEK